MRTVGTVLGAVAGLVVGAFGGAGLATLLIDTSGLGALAVAFYGFFGAAAGAAVAAPISYRIAQRRSGEPIGPGVGVVAAITMLAAIAVSVLIFVTEPSAWYVWLVPAAAGGAALIATRLDRRSRGR